MRILNIARYKFSLFFFAIGLSAAFYTMSYGLLPFSGEDTNIIRNFAYLCLSISMAFSILEGKLRNIKSKYIVWLALVFFSVVLMALNGLRNGNFISQMRYDMATFTYCSAIFVGSERSNWKTLDKILAVHLALGVIIFGYALLKYPVSHIRDFAVKSIAYKVRPMMYPWPYFLLTFYGGSIFRKILTFAGVGAVFMGIILFQKRAPLAEFIFISAFAWYMYAKSGIRGESKAFAKTIKFSFAIVLFVGILYMALQSFGGGDLVAASTKGLRERIFTEKGRFLTVKNAFSYDRYSEGYRFQEMEYFFNEATTQEIIVGRGLGGRVYTPIIGYSTIHIGVGQLILKGGLVFFCIWMLGWLMLIFDFLKSRKSNPFGFGYFLAINYCIFILLIPALNITPVFGLVLLCIGPCMSKWINYEQEGSGVV